MRQAQVPQGRALLAIVLLVSIAVVAPPPSQATHADDCEGWWEYGWWDVVGDDYRVDACVLPIEGNNGYSDGRMKSPRLASGSLFEFDLTDMPDRDYEVSFEWKDVETSERVAFRTVNVTGTDYHEVGTVPGNVQYVELYVRLLTWGISLDVGVHLKLTERAAYTPWTTCTDPIVSNVTCSGTWVEPWGGIPWRMTLETQRDERSALHVTSDEHPLHYSITKRYDEANQFPVKGTLAAGSTISFDLSWNNTMTLDLDAPDGVPNVPVNYSVRFEREPNELPSLAGPQWLYYYEERFPSHWDLTFVDPDGTPLKLHSSTTPARVVSSESDRIVVRILENSTPDRIVDDVFEVKVEEANTYVSGANVFIEPLHRDCGEPDAPPSGIPLKAFCEGGAHHAFDPEDVYTFEAAAGEQVKVEIANFSSALSKLDIEMTTPDGRAVTPTSRDTGFNRATLDLRDYTGTGGAYELRVHALDTGGQRDVHYNISLERTATPPPDDRTRLDLFNFVPLGEARGEEPTSATTRALILPPLRPEDLAGVEVAYFATLAKREACSSTPIVAQVNEHEATEIWGCQPLNPYAYSEWWLPVPADQLRVGENRILLEFPAAYVWGGRLMLGRPLADQVYLPGERFAARVSHHAAEGARASPGIEWDGTRNVTDRELEPLVETHTFFLDAPGGRGAHLLEAFALTPDHTVASAFANVSVLQGGGDCASDNDLEGGYWMVRVRSCAGTLHEGDALDRFVTVVDGRWIEFHTDTTDVVLQVRDLHDRLAPANATHAWSAVPKINGGFQFTVDVTRAPDAPPGPIDYRIEWRTSDTWFAPSDEIEVVAPPTFLAAGDEFVHVADTSTTDAVAAAVRYEWPDGSTTRVPADGWTWPGRLTASGTYRYDEPGLQVLRVVASTPRGEYAEERRIVEVVEPDDCGQGDAPEWIPTTPTSVLVLGNGLPPGTRCHGSLGGDDAEDRYRIEAAAGTRLTVRVTNAALGEIDADLFRHYGLRVALDRAQADGSSWTWRLEPLVDTAYELRMKPLSDRAAYRVEVY